MPSQPKIGSSRSQHSERGKADVAVLLQGSLMYLRAVVCGHAEAEVQVVGIVVRLRRPVAMVLIAGIIAALRRLLPLRILLVLHPSILKPDLDLLQKSRRERVWGRKRAINTSFCTQHKKRGKFFRVTSN